MSDIPISSLSTSRTITAKVRHSVGLRDRSKKMLVQPLDVLRHIIRFSESRKLVLISITFPQRFEDKGNPEEDTTGLVRNFLHDFLLCTDVFLSLIGSPKSAKPSTNEVFDVNASEIL